MALFLSESTYVEDTRSLSDVLIEGIEIAQEFGALSEAILRADYILDQKCKTLNESAVLTLQEGFLSNVGNSIMAAGRKVIQWIKDIAKKVKDKVVEIYNRIKDRVTGNSLDVAKSKIANLEATVSFIEANGKLQEQIAKATNADVVKSLQERATKLKEEFDKKKEANNKLEGNQTVSVTYYEKLVKAAQYNETVANSTTSELEKRIKELEASLSDQKELTSIAQKNSERHRQAANNANAELEKEKNRSDNYKSAADSSSLAHQLARKANAQMGNELGSTKKALSDSQAELTTVKAQLAAAKQLASNNAAAFSMVMSNAVGPIAPAAAPISAPNRLPPKKSIGVK